jgi:hypothetical protein
VRSLNASRCPAYPIPPVRDCAADVTHPTIVTDCVASALGSGGAWFTDEAPLLRWVTAGVVATDGCSAGTITGVTLTQACASSFVTVTAEDVCSNRASAALPVRFDSTPPQLTISRQTLPEIQRLSEGPWLLRMHAHNLAQR